jgi:hypothetical protein
MTISHQHPATRPGGPTGNSPDRQIGVAPRPGGPTGSSPDRQVGVSTRTTHRFSGPQGRHRSGINSGTLWLVALFLILCISPLSAADPRPAVLVVVGAPGTPEFGQQFRQWAARWEAAAQQARADFCAIGLDDPGEKSDRDLFRERLAALASPTTEPLWLVLIGHGTFDGKVARYNLRGADFTAAELAAWLKPIERPLAILDCTSSSGPFINELSQEGRVMITATKSGAEYNFARLGDFLSSAITDLKADLDKDDQVSLLEAFLFASSAVKEFYTTESRLATEHALLDDNGDKLGTPADWFTGLRATKTAKDDATPDGLRACQLVLVKSAREERLPPAIRARRDELERNLAALRQTKSKLSEDAYLAQIEPLLIELARLYEQAEH